MADWSDDFANSSLGQDDVQNLSSRTDISDEEKQKRRKKLEEEVAAGTVGVGILAYAGYHHHEKKEAENQ